MNQDILNWIDFSKKLNFFVYIYTGKEDSSVNIEDSIEESVVKEEEFTDLELLASDEDDDSKDQHKIDEISNNKKSSTLAGGQPDCEDISSDEEEWD